MNFFTSNKTIEQRVKSYLFPKINHKIGEFQIYVISKTEIPFHYQISHYLPELNIECILKMESYLKSKAKTSCKLFTICNRLTIVSMSSSFANFSMLWSQTVIIQRYYEMISTKAINYYIQRAEGV